MVHHQFPLGGVVGQTNLILNPPEVEKLVVGMGGKELDHDPPYVAKVTFLYLKGYSLQLPSDHGQYSRLQMGSQSEEALGQHRNKVLAHTIARPYSANQ